MSSFFNALLTLICFFSRLPLQRFLPEAQRFAPPEFEKIAGLIPLAGLLIALPAACLLFFTTRLGMSSLLVSVVSLSVLILTTGGLHADGLADWADGWGGTTPSARLSIMADSRLGTFGALALFLSLLLTSAALTNCLERWGEGITLLIFLSVAALSRTALLLPWFLLPKAKTQGLSANFSSPSKNAFWIGLVLGGSTVLPLIFVLSGFHAFLLFFGAMSAGLSVTWQAARKIGGQTGDILGAAQQLAQSSALIAVLALPPSF